MDMLRGGFMPGLLGNGSGVIPDSGSGGYDAATEAIAAAFTTPPTIARKTLIDHAVVALKASGVWAKLDCIYMLAAADSQAATINWKAPGSFNLTIVNAPVFTADFGFTGASGKYLDSVWDPATNGVTYTQNSASLHVWNLTAVRVDSHAVIGFSPSGAQINPWNSSVDSVGHGLNNLAVNTFTPGAATGMFSLSRNSSANYDVYRSASLLGNQVTASIAVVSSDFRILSTTGLITTKQIAFGAWGGGLNATEVTSLYNAAGSYLAGVLAIGDIFGPTATSLSPPDNATGVAPTTNLVATFNETVTLAAGNITLKRTSDNATIEAWDVATESGSTAGKVEVVGGTALTMHLTTALADGIEYYVIWDAGVVVDGSANGVAAQASTTAWSFTTVDYDSASDAIFAAFTTPPTTARKGVIDACVLALKAAGVWAKLDNLYVTAAADSQAALINWKSPGTFNLTAVNAPTFTADQGFAGNGSTSYLDSLWDPATNGVTYTQNSASLHVWSRTELRTNGVSLIGFAAAGVGATINPWNSSVDNANHAINNTAQNAFSPGSSIGLFSLSRTSSANYDVYRNGASLGNQVTASVAVGSSDFRICSNTQLYSTRQIAFGAWGGGLTSTEAGNLYSAINTYLMAVGAA